MTNYLKNIIFYFLLLLFFAGANAQTARKDTIKYPINSKNSGGLLMKNGITYQPVYDPIYDVYLLYPKSGDLILGEPVFLTPEQYSNLITQQGINQFYRRNTRAQDDYYRKLEKDKENSKD